ncbi:hypothetical protein LEMLEM_LOCUS7251 [Lemmus lemmus]
MRRQPQRCGGPGTAADAGYGGGSRAGGALRSSSKQAFEPWLFTSLGVLSGAERQKLEIVKLYKFGSQTFCGMLGHGAERLIHARLKKKKKLRRERWLSLKQVPPNHRDYSCSPRFHGCCEKTVIPAAERQETETRMCWPSTILVDNTASIFHLCSLAEDHHSRSDH